MCKTCKRVSGLLKFSQSDLEAICEVIENDRYASTTQVECIEMLGIPIWRELCELFNSDMEEVQHLASMGKISAGDVKMALKRFSALFA